MPHTISNTVNCHIRTSLSCITYVYWAKITNETLVLVDFPSMKVIPICSLPGILLDIIFRSCVLSYLRYNKMFRSCSGLSYCIRIRGISSPNSKSRLSLVEHSNIGNVFDHFLFEAVSCGASF